MNLPDWCVAAGFVRNMVWDRLFQTRQHPLNDLDVIYFDPHNPAVSQDRKLQAQLRAQSPWPWSVKNQARMHLRNQDPPYHNTADAMSYWVETETTTGVRYCVKADQLCLAAPFGLSQLMAGTITLNPKRPKPKAFHQRLSSKEWLKNWPYLRIVETN